MIDLRTFSIEQARELLDSKKISVRELVDLYLDVVNKSNSEINAYLEVFSDDDAITKAQKMIDEGKSQPLTGIPFSIKDNILIKGHIASASSKMLENYVAPYDATVITKLRDQGVIFIGRVNMDEFAMGGSTENSAYGVTKNPIDKTRVAGGTSGGSAASVAMHGALASLGSDTGGSVRQPASFCGVVGLKPTYGSVSRYGLMAMASSFDVIGPITKTVRDSEIVFNAIKGEDPMDATSSSSESPELKKSYSIGVPRNFITQGMDEDVKQVFEQSLIQLKKAGNTIIDIELPLFEYTLPVYYILVPAEVSSNMSRYDGVRFGGHVEGQDLLEDYMNTRGALLGPEVKRRIILGTYVLSSGYYDAYYNKAWQVRAKITENIKNVFKEVDLIAMPISPCPAYVIGEKIKDPLAMYLADIFTVGANVTGVPAISIPAGTVDRGERALPVGLQLLAPHNKESWLFDCGKKFEIL